MVDNYIDMDDPSARLTKALPIAFNRPSFAGKELEYIAASIRNCHISGDGPFTKKVESFLAAELGAPRVLLTTSCTDALELAALLLHIGPGDEVIMPAFTFVSTANAFALRGAKPVFVDIRPDTLNIDERLISAAISPKTRAIVVVHYGGVACEMDTILRVAATHAIAVIEDNAHGLFGAYKGRPLGTLGALGTQSFHETKNFTCGEGGALVINDAALIDEAEILRDKGTNRARLFRGEVDKYTWVSLGSSYVISDLLAAFLLAQFEAKDLIQETRRGIWEAYARGLQTWAAKYDVALPTVPSYATQTYHLFYILLPTLREREALISHLKARDISAVFHYLPLNRSEMAERLDAVTHCPVTEDVSDRLLRLPFHNDLSPTDQQRVIDAITEFQVSA